MKLTSKIIAGTAALAFLTIAAGSLQAQITNVITFTATVKAQKESTDNGTNTITPAPKAVSVTTKTLLGFLAVDEFAEGKFGSTNFPAGAKLVIITGNGDGEFQVLTSSNTFLVDVSDILFAFEGNNNISSGKQNDYTGLANPTETKLHVLTFGYDDSRVLPLNGSTVDLQFHMTGLMTSTKTDTVPNNNTVYMETKSNILTSGVGEGDFQGNPFVITGGLTATGSGKLYL